MQAFGIRAMFLKIFRQNRPTSSLIVNEQHTTNNNNNNFATASKLNTIDVDEVSDSDHEDSDFEDDSDDEHDDQGAENQMQQDNVNTNNNESSTTTTTTTNKKKQEREIAVDAWRYLGGSQHRHDRRLRLLEVSFTTSNLCIEKN